MKIAFYNPIRQNHLLAAFYCLAAVFLAIALVSFHPLDPSLNRATDGEVHNLAGIYGSYIADPMLQFLGLANIFLVIIPLGWGIQKFYDRQISWPLVSFVSYLACIASAALLFDVVKTPESWHFSSLGGHLGHELNRLVSGWPITMTFPISLAIFLVSFFISSKITIEDTYRIISNISWLIISSIRFIKLLIIFAFYPIKLLYNKFKTKPLEFEEPEDIIEFDLKQQLKSTFRKAPTRKEPVKRAIVSANSNYNLPPYDLLHLVGDQNKKNVVSQATLNQNAYRLEQVLTDFGIFGKIVAIHPGPVVTLYELEPAAGTKSARVVGLADDIARSMSAVSARIAVIPGRNAIGIELPNQVREIVYLRELLEVGDYQDENLKLPIVLGKDIGGRSVVVDLSKMPHLLVAGTTGSGKSVAINTMILSLLFRLDPTQCKFIMIDPKMLELSVYDGIPHLLTPVVTEPRKAMVALKWVVKEMENRYRMMSHLGVRNIAGFNKRMEEAKAKNEVLERTVQTGFDPKTGKPIIEKIPFNMETIPFIVVIVDEMADLMLVAGKDIEGSIQRLSQMARAAGIHIIMATQRPSVDVITGVIKANFPTRISFQVTTRIDSRTILGEQGGAEQLLGMGDMLYMSSGSKIVRVHGPFVDDREVEKIVSYLKTQGEPKYIDDVTIDEEGDASEFGSDEFSDGDDLYRQAVNIIATDRKVSTSYIQRCLKIGYNRAATIIDRMEKEGLISEANHVGKREILMPER